MTERVPNRRLGLNELTWEGGWVSHQLAAYPASSCAARRSAAVPFADTATNIGGGGGVGASAALLSAWNVVSAAKKNPHRANIFEDENMNVDSHFSP